MYRKFLSSVLTGILLSLFCYVPVMARAGGEKDAKFIAKVKDGIAKLGTGPNARIEVKLYDKTKLKGYVSEVNEDYFVIVDDKTNATNEVPYPQVKKVKGNNLTTGEKILIGLSIIALIVIIIGISKS